MTETTDDGRDDTHTDSDGADVNPPPALYDRALRQTTRAALQMSAGDDDRNDLLE